MTREQPRTRPGGEPAGPERVARGNDLARLDARIAQLRRGTHPQASKTPLPAWALTQRSGPPADPTPASSQCRTCDRERRDLCPAHGRAHTASFPEFLCGPDWPQLIPHPHRQETRP